MTVPFTTRRRILWGDSDPAGILYTPRVFHYALETVEEWLIEMFAHTSMTLRDNLKIDTPTVKISCEFMFPMKTSEYIDISLEIKKLGNASLNYVFDGFDTKENHCFHVDQVVCFVDADSFKAITIPIEFREKIEAYQISCGKSHEKTGTN
jgi:4-hydroxybenzoyl-CoA thioesterase